MKKVLIVIFLIIAGIGVYSAWQIFGPVVKVPEGGYFYIRTGDDFQTVKHNLAEQHIIGSTFFFHHLAKKTKYNNNIKAGKYAIKKGMSVFQLLKMFKGGRQEPVRLIINKLRTKEDLAGKIGRLFETDSTSVIDFLLNNDSLSKYQLDTNTVLSMVIPNTYQFWWNSTVKNIFSRLHQQCDIFWEGERIKKAEAKGLSKEQVYTLASIVEEESNKQEDKGLIASVYLNRLKKGMRLEADPTVKYAMRDFGLKRIRYVHLNFPSPYNTYRNTGLPPGPICTPSINTIDAVLNAPETNYLFFAAKPTLDGYHNFSSTYQEHLKFARDYQKALDSLMNSRQNNSR